MKKLSKEEIFEIKDGEIDLRNKLLNYLAGTGSVLSIPTMYLFSKIGGMAAVLYNESHVEVDELSFEEQKARAYIHKRLPIKQSVYLKKN